MSEPERTFVVLDEPPHGHVYFVAGLAQYLDEQGEGIIRASVLSYAVVLACPCGHSRWVKSEPTWPIEKMPR